MRVQIELNYGRDRRVTFSWDYCSRLRGSATHTWDIPQAQFRKRVFLILERGRMTLGCGSSIGVVVGWLVVFGWCGIAVEIFFRAVRVSQSKYALASSVWMMKSHIRWSVVEARSTKNMNGTVVELISWAMRLARAAAHTLGGCI